MRNVALFACVFSLVLQCCSFPVLADVDTSDMTKVLLNEDFESYTAGDIIPENSGGNWRLSGDVAYFKAVERERGALAAEFNTVGKTGDGSVTMKFAASETALKGDVAVSFDYIVDSSYSKGMQFNIQPVSGHGICLDLGVNLITHHNGSVSETIFSGLAKDAWYHVEIWARTSESKFDISIKDPNGIVQKAEGLTARGSLSAGIDKLLFAAKRADASVLVDNLMAGPYVKGPDTPSGGDVDDDTPFTAPRAPKDGDFIIFAGDSITEAGGYPNYLQDFYATRYPDKKITYYNAACGGHTAEDILIRYDYDIKPLKDATQIYIMLGTNDFKAFLYLPENDGIAAKDAEKLSRMISAQNNMERLLQKLNEDFPDAEKTVMLDTPVDMVSDWEGHGVQSGTIFTENVNDALRSLGSRYKKLCQTYGANYVDMNGHVLKAVKKQAEMDIHTDSWIVKKDRIHPNNVGQMVMTYSLLKDEYKIDDSIAEVSIDASDLSYSETNCSVSGIAGNINGVKYTYSPQSLPMYATSDYINADALVSWSDDLNREIIKIENLGAGMYDIKLNSRTAAKVSAAELQMGVNIGALSLNPNQTVSLNIYNKSKAKRDKEVLLRHIMAAKTQLIKEGVDLTDADAVIAKLNSYNTSTSIGIRAQNTLQAIDDFNNPMESVNRLINEIKKLENELYALCVPVSYDVEIVKGEDSEPGLLYSENFESTAWPGYALITNTQREALASPQDGKVEIVTENNEKYGKVLNVTDTSSTKIIRADGTFDTGGCKNIRVELDVLPEPFSIIQFTDDSTGVYSKDSNSYFMYICFNSGGRIQYRDQGAPIDLTEQNLYNEGQWNKVIVELDTQNAKYNVYINGRNIISRSTLKWGAGRVPNTITVGSTFSQTRQCGIKVDNIKVYDAGVTISMESAAIYSNGASVEAPEAGSTVKGVVSIKNSLGRPAPVMVVFAQYAKSGELTGVSVSNTTLKSSSEVQIVETGEFIAREESNFKIFVWNANMQPIGIYTASNYEDRDTVLKNIKSVYSSDTTNILTCQSPWKLETYPAKITEELILAPLAEVLETNIDVYSMQAGLCWVPWWPSKVYPVEEHIKWFQENVRENSSNIWLNYVLNGGDMILDSLNYAKENGKDFMLSFRLNDVHQKSDAFDDSKARIESVPRFYREHPEYLVGDDPNQASYGRYVQDWQHEEVREYKLSLIEEIIENYDIDGIELDFLRSTVLFNTTTTTESQRDEIMLNVIKRVRAALDKKPGRYRYLCVRIPAHIYCHNAIGVDVRAFADAGVDIFNISTYYCTEQVTSLKEIKELAGDSLVIFEMSYATGLGKTESGASSLRRATKEQLNTTAYLAYKDGADGISLFNFQYYREQLGLDDPPYSDPPFEIIDGLTDLDYLSTCQQHYYFAENHRDPKKPSWPLPKTVAAGKNVTWEFQLAVPKGGWSKNGKFRIQAKQDISECEFVLKINGTALSEMNDVSEPYPNMYTQITGAPKCIKAWEIPAGILEEGSNAVTLTLLSGSDVVIEYVDLAIQ